MEETEFKVGDKIYHATNSRVLWIIERIDENEAYCSTLIKDTLEQKKEKFALISIVKYRKPQIRTSVIKDRNRY